MIYHRIARLRWPRKRVVVVIKILTARLYGGTPHQTMMLTRMSEPMLRSPPGMPQVAFLPSPTSPKKRLLLDSNHHAQQPGFCHPRESAIVTCCCVLSPPSWKWRLFPSVLRCSLRLALPTISSPHGSTNRILATGAWSDGDTAILCSKSAKRTSKPAFGDWAVAGWITPRVVNLQRYHINLHVGNQLPASINICE